MPFSLLERRHPIYLITLLYHIFRRLSTVQSGVGAFFFSFALDVYDLFTRKHLIAYERLYIMILTGAQAI